jgi:hypothetical protein
MSKMILSNFYKKFRFQTVEESIGYSFANKVFFYFIQSLHLLYAHPLSGVSCPSFHPRFLPPESGYWMLSGIFWSTISSFRIVIGHFLETGIPWRRSA